MSAQTKTYSVIFRAQRRGARQPEIAINLQAVSEQHAKRAGHYHLQQFLGEDPGNYRKPIVKELES